ncbi:MAG: 4-hydroxybenzoate octaprenyltransferase [Nitrospinae bacterium]|nr:4-hydroxybenzoate octaprenyltransferase [Nitrospinota bacterium]
MVKFEHTIFGLPFVLLGAVLAADGIPDLSVLFWMIMAVVGARNFAMVLNRFADRKIDFKNPRTEGRSIFLPLLNSFYVWPVMLFFSFLFFFSSWMLNNLSFYLSFLVFFVIVIYSYSKRFTSFTHLFLGFVLGSAPAGAWIAVRGELELAPFFLFLAVLLWVAGFDLIYSCVDEEFDKKEGLFSIPVFVGTKKSLFISILMHILSVVFFIITGKILGMEILYWIGLGAASFLLVWEHYIVKPDDLTKVNISFFNLNALVSVFISLGGILDVFLRF